MTREPILVTGVGRRLGLHLALNFLERGATVVGTYRRERDDLEQLRERGAELHQCDFQRQEEIDELVGSIRGRHERLRAVIHNASDWLPDNHTLPVGEIMSRMMNVHVSAPYQLNLALAPLLAASDNPHADIIHVGDYVSSRGSKKHIAYAASKAAQDNLTYSFSAKLGPKVEVNSIAPALVLFNECDEEPYRSKALDKSVMRKEGGAEEFQRAVDYLLSSSYVTGRVLPMDGGRHLV